MLIENAKPLRIDLNQLDKQKFHSETTLRGFKMAEVVRQFVTEFNNNPEQFSEILKKAQDIKNKK